MFFRFLCVGGVAAGTRKVRKSIKNLTSEENRFTIIYEQTFAQKNKKGILLFGILDEIFLAAFEDKAPKAIPKWIKWKHVFVGISHCKVCLRLENCWFPEENKPVLPHHPFCHCVSVSIPFSQVLKDAEANSHYSKFDPYLFDPMNEYKHGKNRAFESWGYTVGDSSWLKGECERQALDKYIQGDYALGKLNEQGQHISIRIRIPRKDREGMVSFITGWMVDPNGAIRLITPYGGK